MSTFSLIYEVVRQIPPGKVATYGQIACMAGNPRWSRVVGYALHVNPDPEHIPCFRVVNRKGEEFSSFIKADLETGRLSYSRTPDGFEQRAEFKIPEKVWDVKLTRNQRADLQSGKAVLVEGIKGYDGKTISQYVKANFNQGRLDFYNENPDRKRDASQRNVVANAQKQGQEQAGRKSKGASIA